MSVSDNSAQLTVDDWAPADTAEKEYIRDFIRLPGMWEADQECLALTPTGFCEDGHVQLGAESTCGTRDCPEHWYQWRKDAAENIVARLAAYRYTQEGRGRRMLHVVASPDQEGRWPTERVWDTRSDAYDRVKEHGGRGGVCIPHAYSDSDEANALFASAVENGYDETKGIWRFIRDLADDWEDMQRFVDVAPHNHMLVPWRDLDGDEIKEELPDGEVLHNIRSLEAFYLHEENVEPYHKLDENMKIARTGEEVVRDGFEDMARLTMYLLSHAAVQKGVGEALPERATVTYFGDVHPNGFNPEEELDARDWEKIQRLAAEAVDTTYEPDEDEEGQPDRTCARDECEAIVRPTTELEEYLSDVREYEGWFRSLEFEQQCEIWGLWHWTGDKPPPGRATTAPGDEEERHNLPPGGFERSPDTPDEIRTNKGEVLEWLRRLGRSRLERKPGYKRPDGATA